MGGTTPAQYLRSTQVSGTVYQADPSSAGPTSIATKVTFGPLSVGAGYWWNPETASSTPYAIPAAGAAFGGMGWQMSSDIIPLGDAGRLPAQTINVQVTIQAQTASTLVNFAINVFLYVNGVEIGRNNISYGQLTYLPATPTAYTLPVTLAADTAIPANARMQLSSYLIASNPSATSSCWAALTTNTGSNFGPFTYAIDAVRSPTESRPAAGNTASRTVTLSRASSETTVTSDSASKTSAIVRSATEFRPAATDSAIRSVTFPRVQTEVRPAAIDTASKTMAFVRSPSDIAVVPVDVAARLSTISRSSAQSDTFTAIAAKATTYGRSVRYAYQPGDNPLIDPTRTISGVVRNNDTTPYLGGARVILFREDDVKVAETTSSTVNGSYSFSRNSYDTDTYYVAFFVGGGSPLQAVTERLLSPT